MNRLRNSLFLFRRKIWEVLFVLFWGLGVAVQAWAAIHWSANFDSDEAVVGLMARHILQGQIPVYQYGGNYGSSLEALIAAVFIKLMGSSVLSLRLGTIFVVGLFLALHTIFANHSWGRHVALISLLVLALPGWPLLTFTSRPGTYLGLILTFGTAALLLSDVYSPMRKSISYARLAAFGGVMGLALWTFPLAIIYFVSIGLVYFLRMPEWYALHGIILGLGRRKLLVSRILPLVVLGIVCLLVIVFYSNGCGLGAWFATGQKIARLVLAGMGIGIALLVIAVSARRKQLLTGGLGLAGGFLVGNLPQWGAWMFVGITPSSGIVPSCPTEAVYRMTIVFEQLLPAIWGAPPLSSIPQLAGPRNPTLWTLALILMVIALASFVLMERRTLSSLLSISPISKRDSKTVVLAMLFGLPLVLAVLSGNTANLAHVRYLVTTWQASSIILGLFLSRLVNRSRIVGLFLIGLIVVPVGIGNLVDMTNTWNYLNRSYSPESVATLEQFLVENKVQGGYADYWIAYTLDYLTGERFIFAPYNGGGDRYPPYSQFVATLPVQAYIMWPDNSVSQRPETADLVHELTQGGPERWPALPGILDHVREQTVLKRQRLANWDVWLLTNVQGTSVALSTGMIVEPKFGPAFVTPSTISMARCVQSSCEEIMPNGRSK